MIHISSYSLGGAGKSRFYPQASPYQANLEQTLWKRAQKALIENVNKESAAQI